ncbi:hypothetical protein Aduo_016773 [Ancylostoma duodenale]
MLCCCTSASAPPRIPDPKYAMLSPVTCPATTSSSTGPTAAPVPSRMSPRRQSADSSPRLGPLIPSDSPSLPRRFPTRNSIYVNGSNVIYSVLWSASTMLQILFTALPLDFRIVHLITHISLISSRSEVCWDKFDMNYRNQCLNGQWQQRFYFDHASLTCRQFWYDGCRSDSRNMFEDMLTCQWLCETQPMYKSRACLEDFDQHYKDQCNGGRWRQQYYFDRYIKRCIAFWYDGCTGESENLFQDEQTCLLTCENPAKKDPLKPWHGGDKHKMKEKLEDIYKPNLTDICTVANPCKNNGTCVFVWKKNAHYCKCQAGFTGTNCTEKIDFDPCASNPCKNGATCTAKVQKGKATYECYCAPGYGGPICDQRPCDVNPCLHNGTCRTTAGFSSYFCDCKEGYGGKNCDIAISKKPPEERYGSKVLLVSSGKEEWIQQMKERLGGKKKTTPAPVADEPYKDPRTKKLEREEREKQEAEKRHKEEMEHEAKKQEAERRIEEARLEEEKRMNETLLRHASHGNHIISGFIVSLVIRIIQL